jgi:PAS domain S-box-containing protein
MMDREQLNGLSEQEGKSLASESLASESLATPSLSNTETLFRVIFETAQDSIFIKDRTLKYTLVNPAMEKLFELPTAQLVGKTDEDLFGEEIGAHIRQVDEQVLNGEVIEENPSKPVGGVMHTFQTVKVPMRDPSGQIIGLIGIARDTTGRTQAEKSLRESEKKYRTLIERLPVMVYHVGKGLAAPVQYISPQVEQILGFTPQEWMANPGLWEQLLHPEDRERVLAESNHSDETGEPFCAEYRIFTRDGRTIWLHDECVWVYDEQHQIEYIQGFELDITERKRAEQQLQAALAEKEVLLREIHHRVKNNLMVIASLLDLQANASQDERVRSAIQNSQGRLRAMSSIHEQLYRYDNLAQIDMGHYITGLTDGLRSAYSLSEVRMDVDVRDVKLNIDQAIPCGLILNELLTNALKYAFNNAPVQQQVITVSLVQGDEDDHGEKGKAGVYILQVSDNGAGLPDGLDVTTTRTLGLRLVNGLTDQLHGKLAMKSAPGAGCLFTITFPAQG